MSDPDARAEALRWMDYANGDLLSAREVLIQKVFPRRLACSLAQQAAEKAIKAALTFEGVDFPLTHDLDALRFLLPDGWRVKDGFSSQGALSFWSVEARYPTDYEDPIQSDAETAVEMAIAVWDAIVGDLASRGLEFEGEPPDA
jgi:HEPN domain-containing protein